MGGIVRGEAAGGVDDTVAGKGVVVFILRFAIGMPRAFLHSAHDAAHEAGMIGPAAQGGDTAIGEHPSARYLADDVVDLGTKGDLTWWCCNIHHD